MGAFKGKNAKWLTMVVAIAVLVVFAYISVTNKKQEKEMKEQSKEVLSEIDEAIYKNLDKSYPASVREVIKYYCEVLKCMFNGEVTDKQIEQLVDKERALFDKELLKANDYGEFIGNRQAEIKQYKKAKSKLVKYTVGENNQVKYWKNNGKEMASIKAHIYISGDKYKDFSQEYTLRKDKNGKWKILAWENVTDEKKSENDEKEK